MFRLYNYLSTTKRAESWNYSNKNLNKNYKTMLVDQITAVSIHFRPLPLDETHSLIFEVI